MATNMAARLLLLAASNGVAHPVNWAAGWGLILLAFLTGAAIGIGWHRDEFLGGYGSFRRRVVRLGHIALAALGLMNVVFSLSPLPVPGAMPARLASACFIAGGVLMPLVCFLTGWRAAWRHLFFLPVVSLVAAVIFTLWGGAFMTAAAAPETTPALTPHAGVP